MDKYGILKHYFGYDSFRPGQEKLVDAILAGQDVLGIMPTGAGKSLCYQVPALLMSGITLVVSPLISLMKDQVGALNQAGVHAAYINSSLTDNQITKALAFAKQGRYKIIYVAPERLETWGFLDFATHVEISMITVDEAHCISQWGQDFRPSYLNILSFVKKLARRPIISAFTATATSKVRDDILQILSLERPVILTTGFDRSNLTFKVKHIKDKDSYILDYLVSHRQDSGIIYCATRKNVEKVYDMLNANGLSVTKYHAGLSAEERKENQDKMDEQLSALKHLVYILTDSSVENMEELCADTIRHAEELGIYVQISGDFPQHPSYRLLTDRAIRECVTNCARHAHGSTVLVKIEKGANEYSIRITNDGDAPEKNAEEGGGLSALRKAAESEKCIMQVSFSPEFCLVLKMPLTERMGVYGTDTDSRRSEDHAEVF